MSHNKITVDVTIVDRSGRETRTVRVKGATDRHMAVRIATRDLLDGEHAKFARKVA